MPQPLDYSPASRDTGKLHNAYLRLAAVAGVLLIMLTCFLVGPKIDHQQALIRLQSQCMSFTTLAMQPVFRFDASAPASGTGLPPASNRSPWSQFTGMLGGTYTWFPEAYLHQRRTPAGRKLLVCLRIINGDEQGLLLEQNAVRPAGWLSYPKLLRTSTNRLSLPSKQTLVIYAGQSDPKDESHFTISYAADRKMGIIDGWVEDNGRIRLQPRGP
jgi:hypothetical protein